MATLTGMDGAARYRGCQYKTRAYLTNGRNALRVYDGTTWYRAGIEVFQFTPGVSGAASGKMIGRYRYILQPINANHTTPNGRPVAGMPTFMSAEYNAGATATYSSGETLTIAGIPATHPNSQVTHWAIYRNKGSAYNPSSPIEGQDFYYVDKIAIGTTTYSDNLPDNQLPQNDTLRFPQMPPQGLKNVIEFGSRLFSFGYDPITVGTVTKSTVTISTGTAANNVLTVTTSTAHGLAIGQYVLINTGKPEWDGPRQVITVASTTQFTCASWNDNQAYTTASIAAGTLEYMRFTLPLPDGVPGLWINLPDGNDYRVWALNDNLTMVLDRPYSTGGALSAAAYTIFHKEWEVMVHEFEEPEAAGPIAYAYRWTREVPGQQPARAGIVWNGVLLIFTPQDIYAINGKDPDISNITITPEPLYKGLGCVGMDALDYIEDEVYFMSRRGPAMMKAGGAPQLIGRELRTDWLDSLNSADQQYCTVGCEGRYVYFDYPAATGDVECSLSWRYDRYTGDWYQERYKHAAFYVRADAGDGKFSLYYAQGTRIFQPNVGTFDETTAKYTGTATGGTTTSLTNSGAAFPTASGGLVEAYIHLFNAAGVYQASRRIVGNTATVITWSATGAGGGTVITPAAGWTYKIGNVWWYWFTKLLQDPGHMSKVSRITALFDGYPLAGQAATANLTISEYVDGVVTAAPQKISNDTPHGDYEMNISDHDLQLKLESDDGAIIRGVELDVLAKGLKG